MAGVTSHRPPITRASSSTMQMSDAVSSCHHSPHGLTYMSERPSGCQVMCPAMFSAKPMPARWRKATAIACSSVRSTPMGGTFDGAQTSRPPRRTSFVVMTTPVSIGCPREVGLWRSCRPRIAAARRGLRVVRAAVPSKHLAASRCSTRVGRSSTPACLSSTNMHTRSPKTGSGIATAAATATAGCVATASSTWTALMFFPPRRMKSDVRPVSVR